MRALVVEPAGNLWGSERVLLDFLGSVSGSDWRIAVCFPPGTPIVKRLSHLPMVMYPVFIAGLHRRSRIHRLRAAVGLLKAALQFQPQLLYVNQAGATRIALLVGRLLRIPVITHVRLVEDARYVESLGASQEELPFVICTSHYIQGLFDVHLSNSGRRLVVLYDPYLPQQAWGDAALPESLSPEPVFGCVGRLTKTKGQDVALRAISHLKREGVLTEGHFFGSGELGDVFSLELVELAADLGISDQIHWHGYQEEIQSHLAPMAALVCPSHAESLGRVIFEAWDAGTIPVAWVGSGGAAEVIRDSEAGLLYAEQTGASLARALRRTLYLSPGARQQMVDRGRQWLRNHCDPEEYGERMLALWQDAVETL